MSAAEFNALIGAIGQEMLVPAGFKQKGAHFFLHRPPVIMGVIKASFRGTFKGFHIALTFDFLEGALDARGRPKGSSYLEDYPVSIEAHALHAEYARHNTANEFQYDLNFVSRAVLPTRSVTVEDAFPVPDEAGIRSVFAIALDEGMRLCEEFDPAFAYRVLNKVPSASDPALVKLRTGMEKHARATGVELPKPKKGWFRWG